MTMSGVITQSFSQSDQLSDILVLLDLRHKIIRNCLSIEPTIAIMTKLIDFVFVIRYMYVFMRELLK